MDASEWRVQRWSGLVPTPWANGRGVTREIARSPKDGDFAWRLSAADVPDEAPFSALHGIERHLGVIAGGPLALSVAESRRRIDIGDPPAVFDGGTPAIGAPLEGPVVDLNLMLRSGASTGGLEALDAGAHPLPGGFVAIVALFDGVTVEIAGETYRLDALDTVLGSTDAPGETVVRSAPGASGAIAYLAYATAT